MTPAGRLSVSCTLVALEGPEFWAVSVYVRSWPTGTGSGESDFVRERSAAGVTVVSALAELSEGSDSVIAEETVALLVIDPSLCGRTLIEIVAFAPEASVPREQLTVPLEGGAQVPCDGIAESNVTFAGSASI